MALINCPECGKEISDMSKQCIHCGYPLQELKNVKDLAPSALPNDTTSSPNQQLEPTDSKSGCGTVALIWICIISAFGGFFLFAANDDILIGFICLIVLLIIGVCIYNNGPESLKQDVAEEQRKEEEKRLNGGYKCPNCGRYAGYPIGAIDKSASVWLLGLASNKVGKTYKCKYCDYIW